MHLSNGALLRPVFNTALALCALTLFVLAAPISASAATYYVSPSGSNANPGTSWAMAKQSVQAGINAASSGDQVWVAKGTYTENVTANDGVAVYGSFAGTETSISQRNITANPTILDGSNSGSVYTIPNAVQQANTIDGFIIQNGNSNFGGGIDDQSGASLAVANCTVTNNTAATGGGGISCGVAAIVNSTFTDNTAGGYGGGISFGSSTQILNSTFTNNSASYDGGGADGVGFATFTGCTFTNNSAGNNGGGIFDNAEMTISGCTLSGNAPEAVYSFNTASGYPLIVKDSLIIGTGTTASSPDGINLLIRGNAASSYATISNTTIVNTNIGINITTTSGAVNVANNIFYANNGGLNDNGGVPLTSSHNDLYGNVSYGYTRAAPSSSDLAVDPMFVNAGGGNYRLTPSSTLVQAGDESYISSGDVDLDGDPWLNPPSIGAYEVSTTLTVPAEYATIQAAINASVSGDRILISDGTYTGTGNVDLDFGGKNIKVTSVNGPATTVINCQGSSSANHRGFYLHSGETNAVISGLTIENGYEGNDGGGLLISSASVAVRNCVITNNSVGYDSNGTGRSGGGIYNELTNGGTITVSNCTFTNNSAPGGSGGALLNSATGGTITVTACTFANNSSGGDGGGIGNGVSGNGSISIANCNLTGNSTGGPGGGLYNDNEGNGTITVTNCAVTGSSANSGGGMENQDSGTGLVNITNCTLTGNSAGYGGGGITDYYNSSSTITLTNDILYGDSGGELGGNSITANYCDIGDSSYAGTNGNIDANPLFVNSPTDLHLQSGSPCLGAGTASGAPTTTLDGYTRPNPPSIGAYEAANNPPLASLSFSPTTVTSGTNTTGLAALTGRAATTAVIALSSSNPSALSVPSTVTIGATYTTVHFTATSHAVSTATTVTVTATYYGVSKTATVTVNPVPSTLSSISATPISVTGGSANATGVVGLTGKATATTTITLTSSNPSALSVPASVTINPTYTTVHFTATSHSVTTSTTVTITATLNGVSKTTTVTVLAPALASVSTTPSTIQGGSANSIGTVTLTGKAAATVGVTLTSSNSSALSVPYTVNIGAGYNSKTFTATSHAVTTSTTVTITATYRGISQTTQVTVTP